jgi:hypothetical protein
MDNLKQIKLINTIQIIIRITATKGNEQKFLSQNCCRVQGNSLERDAILNCWLCAQIWKVAQFMFIPIPSIIIPSSQRVSGFFLRTKFWAPNFAPLEKKINPQ